MKHHAKLRLAAALTAVSIAAVGLSACGGSQGQSPYAQVKTATLDQKPVDFGAMQQAGKVVIVNFWATTCTTCKKEMPKMVEMYQQYHPKGVEYVAVAMQYDNPEIVKNYTAEKQLPFLNVWDSDGKIATAFGEIIGTPTTYIIDKNGKSKKYISEPDWKQFYADLDKALAS